ncbi:acetyl-CoA carboxylase biotin carboxylase subunit family protein [Streptomyces sp. NPDC102364]|uniref:ATP-grasp domain-containing protein n=1 Tax=Streptomyces sp. NPDC102364 TaxID=3366161 RepID=UPI0038087EA7
MSQIKRLAIIYDGKGSANLTDIISAVDGIAVPIFVLVDGDADKQMANAMSRFAGVCDIDGLSDEGAIARLQDERPDGIITFSDYQLERTALFADQLQLPFHSIEVARKLTHKSIQRKLLNECGASSVRTQLVSGKADAVSALASTGLPAVLKPDVGTGSKSTYRITTLDGLVSVCDSEFNEEVPLPSGRDFVLESEMSSVGCVGGWGDFVSVESLVFDGVICHMAVTGKFPLAPPYRETGAFLPADLPDSEEKVVLNVATKALRSLGIRFGICHTEVKFTHAGPQVIEVNGRLGGSINALMRDSSGVSAVEMAARIALGDRSVVDSVSNIDFSAISFTYQHLPPVEAVRVTGLQGMAKLRAMPEIFRTYPGIRPGEEIDWRSGSLGYLYICYGAVDSYKELRSTLDDVCGIVEIDYDLVGGEPRTGRAD